MRQNPIQRTAHPDVLMSYAFRRSYKYAYLHSYLLTGILMFRVAMNRQRSSVIRSGGNSGSLRETNALWLIAFGRRRRVCERPIRASLHGGDSPASNERRQDAAEQRVTSPPARAALTRIRYAVRRVSTACLLEHRSSNSQRTCRLDARFCSATERKERF